MAADNEQVFRSALLSFAALYPSMRLTDITAAAYWQHLRDLPLEALLRSIDSAARTFTEFFPTAPQLRIIAVGESTKISREGRQLMLDRQLAAPEVPNDHGCLVEAFVEACNRVESKALDAITDDNAYLFEGLLVALGSVFGVRREVMIGDRIAETTAERVGLVRGMVDQWRKAGRHPAAVVSALRQVPELYVRMPTIGMLDTMIEGGPPWGDGFMRPK